MRLRYAVRQMQPLRPLKGRGQWKLRLASIKSTNKMDEPRDVQTSQRSGSRVRQLLSASSAVAMEIKRKKIRQSTLFLATEVMWEVIFERCCLRAPFLLSTFDRKVRSTQAPTSTCFEQPTVHQNIALSRIWQWNCVSTFPSTRDGVVPYFLSRSERKIHCRCILAFISLAFAIQNRNLRNPWEIPLRNPFVRRHCLRRVGYEKRIACSLQLYLFSFICVSHQSCTLSVAV